MWYQNDPNVILNTYRPSKLPWMTYLALSEILAIYVPLILLLV